MTLNAFLALAAITAVGATQAQPPSLEVGKPVAAEIGGETHVYRVALKAGQAMHVVVNQLGADIVLRILDSNAKRLVEVDSPTDPTGQESAWLVATADGDYAVEVRPFGKDEKGLYELRLDVIRFATPDDRSQVALQDAFAEADRLRRLHTPDGERSAIEKLKEVITLARALDDATAARGATRLLATLSSEEAARTLQLSALKGLHPVYFSAGGEERASSLQGRFESGVRFFEQTLSVTPKIGMVVLSRDDWDWLAVIPYPTNWSRYIDGTGLVGLPATDETAKIYIPNMRATLPAATIQELEAGGMSFDQGMRSQFDDSVYHELGHVYTSAAGIGTPNLWLGEFLAHYLSIAHAAQDSTRSSGRKFEETGLDWLNEHVKPTFRSLQDFDRLWVQLPPDNYAWFHAQFTRRAHAVYRNQGLDFLKRVKAAFPASERGPLPVDEILSRLEKIAPGFVEWAAELAARK